MDRQGGHGRPTFEKLPTALYVRMYVCMLMTIMQSNVLEIVYTEE